MQQNQGSQPKTQQRAARPLLYLWFPFLAVEERLRHDPDRHHQPFVLTKLSKGTERLVALNKPAEQQGLKISQTLADARTLVQGLSSEVADIQQTSAFLSVLVRFSEQFSPLVGTSGPKMKPDTGICPEDSLVLDIGGIAHLFGGEAKMLQQVVAAFQAFDLTVKASIATNKAAARALCLYGSDQIILSSGNTFEVLKKLPVQALEPSQADAKIFAHLGFSILEQIVNLPRGGLTRRFGLGMLERIDQLFGRVSDPIEPIAIKRPFSISLKFPDPLSLQDDLAAAVERLLPTLLDRLQSQGKGMMQLGLSLTPPNGVVEHIDLNFATPNQDLSAILRLLEPKLDSLVSEFGFEHIRLQALKIQNLNFKQTSLSENAAKSENLSQLHNLLGNRFGFARVCQFQPVPTHLPEQSYQLRSVLNLAVVESLQQTQKRRPLSSFSPEPVTVNNKTTTANRPPEQFAWRRRHHHLKRAFGPERVTPPWWQPTHGWEQGARDYWQIETQEGACLWLFTLPQKTHALEPQWFVSGNFH